MNFVRHTSVKCGDKTRKMQVSCNKVPQEIVKSDFQFSRVHLIFHACLNLKLDITHHRTDFDIYNILIILNIAKHSKKYFYLSLINFQYP
jgi:hypothetical protein